MSLKVALVDDHAMFREGIRAVLTHEHEFQVVGEAGDAHTAFTVVDETRPDVVLLDITLPGSTGITVARELRRRHPKLKMLIASMHLHEDFVAESFAAGAMGFIGKEQPTSDLLEAIRAVSQGMMYVSPKLSRVVVDEYIRLRRGQDGPATPLSVLSKREKEVFELLIQGMTNEGVASYLCISRRTVETHRAHVLRKLNSKSVSDLVRFAMRHGLTTT